MSQIGRNYSYRYGLGVSSHGPKLNDSFACNRFIAIYFDKNSTNHSTLQVFEIVDSFDNAHSAASGGLVEGIAYSSSSSTG